MILTFKFTSAKLFWIHVHVKEIRWKQKINKNVWIRCLTPNDLSRVPAICRSHKLWVSHKLIGTRTLNSQNLILRIQSLITRARKLKTLKTLKNDLIKNYKYLFYKFIKAYKSLKNQNHCIVQLERIWCYQKYMNDDYLFTNIYTRETSVRIHRSDPETQTSTNLRFNFRHFESITKK
jgi:hypothetical protein